MRGRLIVLTVALLLLLAGCGVGGRGCRGTNPPPPTATWPAPPTVAPPTATQEVGSTVVLPPTRDIPPATAIATSTRPISTATRPPGTPVPTPVPTPAATGTPELIGAHLVVAGDTMYEIGLWWYAGWFFAWGREVWEPICAANPEIEDCRMIFPGDVLRIPRLP